MEADFRFGLEKVAKDFKRVPNANLPLPAWHFDRIQKVFINTMPQNDLGPNTDKVLECMYKRVQQSFFPLHLSLRDHLVNVNSFES